MLFSLVLSLVVIRKHASAKGFATIITLPDLHLDLSTSLSENFLIMHIAHVAFWTVDLERAATFYRDEFGAHVGPEYHSARRQGFVSRFLQFKSGPSIELMQLPGLEARAERTSTVGWAHIAIALGSEAAVKEMANRMEKAGTLVSPPRWTGDGYFEAVITDPDGNEIEITV